MSTIETIVYDLNMELFEKYKLEDYQFQYESTGFSCGVSFQGLMFWTDDDTKESDVVKEDILIKFKNLQKLIASIDLDK